MAIPAAIGAPPFLHHLSQLLSANPDLAVQTRITTDAIDLVAGGIDIGVVVGHLPETSFVARLLGRATWVLAATPAYLEVHGRPQQPSELRAHRCLRLLAHPPQDHWVLVDRRGRETRVPVTGTFQSDDSRVLADATYAGLGIGVRPAGECARAEAEGRLERVVRGHHFEALDVHALVA